MLYLVVTGWSLTWLKEVVVVIKDFSTRILNIIGLIFILIPRLTTIFILAVILILILAVFNTNKIKPCKKKTILNQKHMIFFTKIKCFWKIQMSGLLFSIINFLRQNTDTKITGLCLLLLSIYKYLLNASSFEISLRKEKDILHIR